MIVYLKCTKPFETLDCPFINDGYCNIRGIHCPDSYEDEDGLYFDKAPDNCPLRDNDITVRGVEIVR